MLWSDLAPGLLMVALGLILGLVWAVRRRGGGGHRVSVGGDVSGQVVTADRIDGGVQQVQGAAPPPTRSEPPSRPHPRSLDVLSLVIGLLSLTLTTLGVVLTWVAAGW